MFSFGGLYNMGLPSLCSDVFFTGLLLTGTTILIRYAEYLQILPTSVPPPCHCEFHFSPSRFSYIVPEPFDYHYCHFAHTPGRMGG